MVLANKIDNPADIFTYMGLLFSWALILLLVRLLYKSVAQQARSNELLNILVYRNGMEKKDAR